jgi:hypothetical protein
VRVFAQAKEKDRWRAAAGEMKRRMTKAEAQRQQQEAEAAEIRGGLEGQLSGQKQAINDLQEQLGGVREQVRNGEALRF